MCHHKKEKIPRADLCQPICTPFLQLRQVTFANVAFVFLLTCVFIHGKWARGHMCEILLFLGLKSYTKTHLTWRVVVIVCFARTSDWSNTSEVQRCQALNLQTPNETWVFMFGWEVDLLGMRLFCVTSVVACFYFQKLRYVYIFQGCRRSHASE